MESQQFLYNAPMDVALRNVGIWPYFGAYGLVFLLAFAAELPSPVQLPLVAQHERTYAAPIWAFLISYPLFHALMKPRVLRTFGRLLNQCVGATLGVLITGTITWFLFAEMPDSTTTRAGRALANPVGAGAFLVAASCTVSVGCFLVIEPLRERVMHWLRKAVSR